MSARQSEPPPGQYVSLAANGLLDARDHWMRMFNRLDAAITHHKRDCEANDVPDTHDEALWAARDRVLRDSADPAR